MRVPYVRFYVPARLNSTRLPGKVLKRAGGQSILEWVYQACKVSSYAKDAPVICTPDTEIVSEALVVSQGNVCVTSPDIECGTDRVLAAYLSMQDFQKFECDVIVNVQADEPRLTSVIIDRFIYDHFEHWGYRPDAISTLACSAEGGTRVVMDHQFYAMHFTRSTLPNSLRHLGVYAYHPEQLKRIAGSSNEASKAESLEQMAWVYDGCRVAVLPQAISNSDVGSIDSPEDYEEFCRWIEGE